MSNGILLSLKPLNTGVVNLWSWPFCPSGLFCIALIFTNGDNSPVSMRTPVLIFKPQNPNKKRFFRRNRFITKFAVYEKKSHTER